MIADPELKAQWSRAAAEAGRDLERATPQDILAWALDMFGDRMCIACSMSDAVLIDMAAKIRAGVDVVFLDTGYHFAETLETAERVKDRYDVNLLQILPKQTVAEQDEMFGERLHDRDPDACCNLRKVDPLRRGLQAYHAWASGIRRDESATRTNIGVIEWDSKRGMVKVNPLATWTEANVMEYVMANDVEMNPLLYQGYPSIGCAPCTRKVALGEDPRSGRWAGSGKTECGLHLG